MDGETVEERFADDILHLVVGIDTVSPDDTKVHEHPTHQVEGIIASVRKHGQVTPIVVNVAQNNKVIKGNGTWEALKRLGWSRIAAVRVNMDPKQAMLYLVDDNETAKGSTWDLPKLYDELTKSGASPAEVTTPDREFLSKLLREARPERQLLKEDVEGDRTLSTMKNGKRSTGDSPDKKAKSASRGIIPLAILLDRTTYDKWETEKEKLGLLSDTDMLERIFEIYCNLAEEQ